MTINHHYYHHDDQLSNHFLLIIKQQKTIMDELQKLNDQVAELLGKTKTLQTSVDAKQEALATAFGAFELQIAALKDQLAKETIDPTAIAAITDQLVMANTAMQTTIDDVAATPVV